MTVQYVPEFKCFWPTWDTKPTNNYRYIQDHLKDMDYAISKCKDRSLAIQAGGHVGFWPIRLASHFEMVWTFEPEPDLYACLDKNTLGLKNVRAHNVALGDTVGQNHIKRSGSSGKNNVGVPGAKIPIDVVTIDSIAANVVVSAIFLDVEHYESRVIDGALRTIKRDRPVIQAEELSKQDQDDVWSLLKLLNYTMDIKQGSDRIYLP